LFKSFFFLQNLDEEIQELEQSHVNYLQRFVLLKEGKGDLLIQVIS
jgi:hypothetical protein